MAQPESDIVMARRISHVLEDALEIAKDQERIPYEAPLDAMLLLPVEKLIEKLLVEVAAN